MAKTVLNLKLNYKGKLLDISKAGRDFTKQLFIGTDKHLFWQILDPSFPNKHQFLVKRGDDYYLQLLPGANVSCSHNGNPVDASYLQQNGILKGSNLLLRNDMAGTIALNPDWEIKYEYTEPWVRVLTEEERMIVAQYSRRAELTAAERFNRSMVILFLLLTIAFLLIYDFVLKPEAVDIGTLEARLAMLEEAQRVEVPLPTGQQAFVAGTETGEVATEATEVGTPGGVGTANVGATFGGIGVPGGTGDPNAPFQAATFRQSFVTATPGARGGGGGTGTGPGGGGSGIAGAFDPSATGGYSQTNLGQVAFGQAPAGGTTMAPPSGSVAIFTGDAGRIVPRGRPVAQSAQTAAVIQSFSAANVTTIQEGSIISAPEELRPEIERIQASVNGRKGQITQIYRKYAAQRAMSGSITIELFISSNGQVDAAEVIPNSENFTEGFLKEVKALVESWSFNVSQRQRYRFTVRLTQG